MTTSMTDARFTSLHFTPGHLASLDFDPPPESGWGVMPGFDESLDIPLHLEPPRMDADETLPNMIHPSYPLGRPQSKSTSNVGGRGVERGVGGVGNLLGTIEGGERRGRGEDEDEWSEMGVDNLVWRQRGREVPPGMAGAKRPPSPPSPALRPSDQSRQPRSVHLQNLYARRRQSPVHGQDPFDGPVPNEIHEQNEDQGQGEEGGEDDGEEGEEEGEDEDLDDGDVDENGNENGNGR